MNEERRSGLICKRNPRLFVFYKGHDARIIAIGSLIQDAMVIKERKAQIKTKGITCLLQNPNSNRDQRA